MLVDSMSEGTAMREGFKIALAAVAGTLGVLACGRELVQVPPRPTANACPGAHAETILSCYTASLLIAKMAQSHWTLGDAHSPGGNDSGSEDVIVSADSSAHGYDAPLPPNGCPPKERVASCGEEMLSDGFIEQQNCCYWSCLISICNADPTNDHHRSAGETDYLRIHPMLSRRIPAGWNSRDGSFGPLPIPERSTSHDFSRFAELTRSTLWPPTR